MIQKLFMSFLLAFFIAACATTPKDTADTSGSGSSSSSSSVSSSHFMRQSQYLRILSHIIPRIKGMHPRMTLTYIFDRGDSKEERS